MNHRSWSVSVQSEKLLSIITVTLNTRTTLRKCIRSLSNLTHNYSEYCEHLIIDGSYHGKGENDLEALGYSDISTGNLFTSRRFLKESDDGLYHAMEKGVSASHGRYIWFLNDDDYLQSLNFAALRDLLAGTAPVVVVGTIRYRETINGITLHREFSPQSISYEELIFDGSLRRLPHPATIVKKTHWPRFDHQYAMIADYVALAAVLKRSKETTAFPALTVTMVRGEEQLSKKNRLQRNQEVDQFHEGLQRNRKKAIRFWFRLCLWAFANWRAVLKKETSHMLGYVTRYRP